MSSEEEGYYDEEDDRENLEAEMMAYVESGDTPKCEVSSTKVTFLYSDRILVLHLKLYLFTVPFGLYRVFQFLFQFFFIIPVSFLLYHSFLFGC